MQVTERFPEIYHNEITGFELKKFPFLILFLENASSGKNSRRKKEAFKKLLRLHKTPVLTVHLNGKTPEEKTWNSVILSHFVSFYLAEINKTHPIQTRLIDKLKQSLK